MKTHTVKNIAFTALFGLMLSMVPARSYAQVQASMSQPLINQYVENDKATSKASWWNLLGRQLTHSIDKPYDEVTDSELQNIIFFAANHKEKVKLNDAIPSLVVVLRNHQDDGIRLMAVAALEAIGTRGAMVELKKAADVESSPRIKRIAYAAVGDYFTIK